MPIAIGPVRRLPEPAEVHRHIGLLLRELKLSRQLLRLSQESKALESIADAEGAAQTAQPADAEEGGE